MDRMLYISMTGAKQIELAQAANANNLANVSTSGFRADLAAFRSMPVFGPGHPSRVYAMAERPGIDFTPGAISTTQRDLDIAVNGKGWIAVQAPDGTEAYTRAGDLQITHLGVLQTGTGLPVLGNDGPIAVPPAEKLEIGSDGTISVRPLGQSAATLAVVDRIKLVNPDENELEKDEDGLIRVKQGTIADADASVTVVSGSLEASNVNPVDAMVNMIVLARRYEMQIKMMKTAEDNDASAAQLMRMS